jgi:hypothetical protein
MTDKELFKLALDALKKCRYRSLADEIVDPAIAALKERLAQEKALQALHNENERLGLYKDAYAEPGQEPVAWMWDVNNGGGHTTRDVGLYQTSIPFAKHTPLYTHPPQRTEEKNT